MASTSVFQIVCDYFSIVPVSLAIMWYKKAIRKMLLIQIVWGIICRYIDTTMIYHAMIHTQLNLSIPERVANSRLGNSWSF